MISIWQHYITSFDFSCGSNTFRHICFYFELGNVVSRLGMSIPQGVRVKTAIVESAQIRQKSEVHKKGIVFEH